MSDAAYPQPDHLRLDMYRLGKTVRALLKAGAAWYRRQAHADTSIAWEDGESVSGGPP